MTKLETDAWTRGYKAGISRVINRIRDILENSENRISIITIVAAIDDIEQELSRLK